MNNFSFAWQPGPESLLETAHTKDATTAWWILGQIYDFHKVTINMYKESEYKNISVFLENGREVKRRIL